MALSRTEQVVLVVVLGEKHSKTSVVDSDDDNSSSSSSSDGVVVSIGCRNTFPPDSELQYDRQTYNDGRRIPLQATNSNIG
ncbi:Hypothetical predicted protein [Octopus vulgaris]|uniref:Uncharacterized protein n=1 Tax=Octopus vulgaris TaxID=6645 RepID=A0AA36B8Z3_OCTVU|nr:Hypothetical predicted protein [Octopus vulgaris]